MRKDPISREKILVAHKNRIFLDALEAACKNSRLEIIPLDSGSVILPTLESRNDFVAIMLDYQLIEDGGISALENLIANPRGLAVLVFEGTIPDWMVRLALDSGLMGLIPENMRLSALPSLLDVVRNGVVYAAPRWQRDSEQPERAPRLTAREEAAVCRASAGQTNAQIAEALGCTLATVKGLMRTAGRKLGAATRVQICLAYAQLTDAKGEPSAFSTQSDLCARMERPKREFPAERQSAGA